MNPEIKTRRMNPARQPAASKQPEIIHPNLLPAHEQDMWRVAFGAALAVNYPVGGAAERADAAVRALRDVARTRAGGV